MNYAKLQQETQKRKEQFIANRANIENTLKEYGERLVSVPAGVIDHLVLPEPFTAQTILPSMYEDNFNFEKYSEERQVFNTLLAGIEDVMATLMKDAEALLNA